MASLLQCSVSMAVTDMQLCLLEKGVHGFINSLAGVVGLCS
jgi:hypothetical protein